MKKSELKKIVLEALTPDEAAKVEPKYKETYAAMIKGKGPLKLKKYDNPDKVVRGRVVNTIKNESLKIAEKLGKKAKVGDYIEDFTDSNAPQFKGKSDKKKKQMAVAAFLNKEEQKLDEIDAMMEDAKDKSEKNYSNYFKKMDKNRLEELVKAALMGPMNETSTDKYDDNPALKGKQSDLPDGLQKAIIKKADGKVDENIYNANSGTYIDPSNDYKEYKAKEMEKVDKTTLQIQKVVSIMSDAYIALGKELKLDTVGSTNPRVVRYMNEIKEQIKDLKRMLKGMTNESFDSLSKKIDKQKGKSKKDADNIAGYIANIKRKGGGKGPTAKQKKRMAETILKELRGNVNEALNKPLDKFGKDVEKRLNALGFETKVFGGQETVPSSAVDQIQKNPKLAGMSYAKIKPGEASNTSDRDYEHIEVVVNAQKLNQLKKVKSYFQTADGNYGPDKDLGWIIKNVKKTNPGDIIGSDIQKYGDRAILSYHTSLPGGEKVKTRDA